MTQRRTTNPTRMQLGFALATTWKTNNHGLVQCQVCARFNLWSQSPLYPKMTPAPCSCQAMKTNQLSSTKKAQIGQIFKGLAHHAFWNWPATVTPSGFSGGALTRGDAVQTPRCTAPEAPLPGPDRRTSQSFPAWWCFFMRSTRSGASNAEVSGSAVCARQRTLTA